MWDAAAMLTLVGYKLKVGPHSAAQFVVDALANGVKISQLVTYFNWED
jgi:hypothetical protein